ncbi:hypothetical protein JOB18_044471 [Solea senegalensis]|uniref:Uncharacterized protein n=1 Tax=Solea senegalensis TaxID=28829 RepID=A0AAV6S8K0_SOLSE|nr:hypothetical protein JOB18_044471 [Solea senegalensis]
MQKHRLIKFSCKAVLIEFPRVQETLRVCVSADLSSAKTPVKERADKRYDEDVDVHTARTADLPRGRSAPELRHLQNPISEKKEKKK